MSVALAFCAGALFGLAAPVVGALVGAALHDRNLSRNAP